MGGALVGRETVTAHLCAVADDALAGHGRLLFITGEAGIGKTALAADVTARAEARGAAVHWAACWQGDGTPAFWPWMQIVGSLVEDEATELFASGTSPAPRPDPGADRFVFFEALTSRLLSHAQRRPRVVVLDDLQWADEPSVRLLHYLAQRVRAAPVLAIGIYRDDEVSPDHPVRTLLARAGGGTNTFPLAGLAAPDVARLMAQLTGAPPDPRLAIDISGRTGGNPFFIREVTRLLGAGGGTASIPQGVRQVIAQRLARLSSPTVRLLEAAAVAGRAVGSDLLAQVTGTDPAGVADTMASAVRAGVVAEPATAAGPYRFVHDLFRQTIHDGLSVAARAALHLRLAEVLDVPEPSVPAAELAHHFLQAALGLGQDQSRAAASAVRHSLVAGERAVAALAYEDGAGNFDRALVGLGVAGLLDDADRMRLLLGRAEARRRAGDAVRAKGDFDDAGRLARELGDGPGLARAALGAHALGSASAADDRPALVLLEEAAVALGDRETPLHATVLAALAREMVRAVDGDRARAAALSTEAVGIARRVADDATLAWCLLARHDSSWAPGTAAQRLEIAEEMAAIAHRAGDVALEAEARLLCATARLESADPLAHRDLDSFLRLAGRVRQPRLELLATSRLAMAATMAGRFDEAEALGERAAALAVAVDEPDVWNVTTRALWTLRSAQGRRAEVESVVAGCPYGPPVLDWYRAQVGLARLERGERAEAEQIIRAAVGTPPAAEPGVDYILLAAWAEMGTAAAAVGQLDACRRYYDCLAPFAGGTVLTAAAVSFDGAVDHHLGLLAAALGRRDDAVRHLERAERVHERLGAIAWLARTRAELAAALADRNIPGDSSRVAALAAAARATATELGMAQVLRQLDLLAARREGVFRREGDVWLISFDGREIRLRDAKGLRDIALLLGAAGREIPAVTLAGAPDAVGGDPVLDERARREYRARLAEIEADMESADRDNDPERAAAARHERDFLVRELAAAVGLGGRARGLGDDRERARKAVTARIQESLRRIAEAHPALGAHLLGAITTGHLCCYRSPDPIWRIGR